MRNHSWSCTYCTSSDSELVFWMYLWLLGILLVYFFVIFWWKPRQQVFRGALVGVALWQWLWWATSAAGYSARQPEYWVDLPGFVLQIQIQIQKSGQIWSEETKILWGVCRDLSKYLTKASVGTPTSEFMFALTWCASYNIQTIPSPISKSNWY